MSGKSEDGFATRVPPTVSKDKSMQLALNKLERGWVLVIGRKGKNANLFKPGKGFNPILFSVAARLQELGLIREDGPHFMGTRYVLSENADPKSAVKTIVSDEDDLDSDDDDSDYDDVDNLSEVESDYTTEDDEMDVGTDSETDSDAEDEIR